MKRLFDQDLYLMPKGRGNIKHYWTFYFVCILIVFGLLVTQTVVRSIKFGDCG